MNRLNKWEQRFGKFAIPNLTIYIIATYILGYFLDVLQQIYQVNILAFLSLNPYAIARGEVWRLVTWVVAPPTSFSIWTIVMLFFYYQLGMALEKVWGKFLYNIYIFFGLCMTVVGAFILYFIMGKAYFQLLYVNGINLFTTYYVSLSIFFGFAMTFPDEVILFMFFLPMKIKYLALADVLFFAYDIVSSRFHPVIIVMVVTSLANVILFFLLTRRGFDKNARAHKKRQKAFRDAVSGRSGAEAGRRRTSYPDIQAAGKAGGAPRHRCAVCGRTELDDPNLEFRYCTKCNGNYEYCQDHLFTHTHIE